ncbi:MAG: GDSL-type esterase/lipase family protein, partial [Pseudomonadales bacterium]
VSGETTGGGLIRLPNALEVYQPDILILELGGNDGLRGYPIEKIRQNLEAMLADASASGAKTLLVGMVLPPNYGRRYITAFEGLFGAIAKQHGLPYVPFPLNSSHAENLLQADGIHPTAEAQPMILDSVWQGLLPLLTDD